MQVILDGLYYGTDAKSYKNKEGQDVMSYSIRVISGDEIINVKTTKDLQNAISSVTKELEPITLLLNVKKYSNFLLIEGLKVIDLGTLVKK